MPYVSCTIRFRDGEGENRVVEIEDGRIDIDDGPLFIAEMMFLGAVLTEIRRYALYMKDKDNPTSEESSKVH